ASPQAEPGIQLLVALGTCCRVGAMKTTRYFQATRMRPDRAWILDEWIARTIANPERRFVQADGRMRCWARVPEADGRYLRVVLLSDGQTVHNAFFDRSFVP
ncbi:MAG: hypothetical protein ACREPJ_10255, partial [Rhodanobacteraceae bacterium]